jgi:tetratricopeptide (TPR) repeat protein
MNILKPWLVLVLAAVGPANLAMGGENKLASPPPNAQSEFRESTADEEVSAWTKSIRDDPRDNYAYFCRGCAYMTKGDHDKAIADFTEAIRLNPGNQPGVGKPQIRDAAAALTNRGCEYAEKFEYDKAIADYEAALRLEPSDTAAISNRARARYCKGELEKAIADYSEVIRLEPKDGLNRYVRALAHLRKGDPDEAIADLTDAIRLTPDFVWSYVIRGGLFSDKGDFDKAIADFSEAIRLEPDSPSAYNGRADAYARKGDLGRARADYQRALAEARKPSRLGPKDPTPHQIIGGICATCPVASLRDGKRAVQEARIACDLYEWESPYGLDVLAAAYAEAGDFDAAVKWQTEAIKRFRFVDKLDRAGFRSRLELYRQRKPFRQPWRSDKQPRPCSDKLPHPFAA